MTNTALTKKQTTELDLMAQVIRADLNTIKLLGQEKAFRAVRIGAALLYVKKVLPHGALKWATANSDLSERSCRMYMKLAIAYQQESQLADARVYKLAAANDKTEKKPACIRDVIKFIGERSLNDLLIHYGIKQPAPTGGSSAGRTSTITGKQANEKDESRASWTDLTARITLHGKELKSWQYLDDDERQGVATLLAEVSKDMGGTIIDLPFGDSE